MSIRISDRGCQIGARRVVLGVAEVPNCKREHVRNSVQQQPTDRLIKTGWVLGLRGTKVLFPLTKISVSDYYDYYPTMSVGSSSRSGSYVAAVVLGSLSAIGRWVSYNDSK